MGGQRGMGRQRGWVMSAFWIRLQGRDIIYGDIY